MRSVSSHVLGGHAHSGLSTGQSLLIHVHRPDVAENLVDDFVTRQITGRVFESIRIVGHQSYLEATKEWFSASSALGDRLLRTVENEKAIKYLAFCPDRKKHEVLSLAGAFEANPESQLTRWRERQLASLFHRTSGLVKAPKGFHYIKPSKKHVSQFLRAANVMEEPWGADVVAFWLLPYIWGQDDVNHIATDTAGISAVASELAYQTRVFEGLQALPTISSFSSYDGLERQQLPPNALYIISASTSGDLRSEMVSKGAQDSRIVTLFYGGDARADDGYTLCNLFSNPEIDFKPIKSHSPEACTLCLDNSFPVSLRGDQFSPEPPTVDPIEIRLTDFVPEAKSIVNDFAGTGLFKVYRAIGAKEAEFYLDLDCLLSTTGSEDAENSPIEKLRKRIHSVIRRGMPIHLRRIIPTSYPYSSDLADIANSMLKGSKLSPEPVIVLSPDLPQQPVEQDTAASLVIAACLDDPQELMAISRDLRSVQPGGNSTYIAPFFRAESATQRTSLRSTISRGEHGKDTFSFYSIFDIDLPACNPNHSWKTELRALRKINEWADEEGISVPSVLGKRIDALTDAPRGGLAEGLFLPDPDGSQLALRSDFTFLDGGSGKRTILQADVYYVLSIILHSLRLGLPRRPRLQYRNYERAVLAPQNFTRFNDGVIHAAILRAARDRELSYNNCDPHLSEDMMRIILSLATSSKANDRESLNEFALALVCNRLRLHNDHMKQVVDTLVSVKDAELCTLMARFLVHRDYAPVDSRPA